MNRSLTVAALIGVSQLRTKHTAPLRATTVREWLRAFLFYFATTTKRIARA